MKNILVPTDFSECAGYATDFAVALVAKSGGNVFLYSNIPVHPLWDNLSEKQKMEYPESFAGMYDLMNHFQEFIDAYNEPNVTFHCRYSAGSIHQAVENLAKEEDIDLILVGSHGSSGLREVLYGSNAQKIVRNVPFPTLVVKAPVGLPTFKKVVFASDFKPGAEVAFRQMLDFLSGMDATVSLLNIRLYPEYAESTQEVKEQMARFEMMAKDMQTHSHISYEQDLEEGVKHYLEDFGADLLVMQREEHSRLFRIILGSSLESLINHTEIPVLVLNDFNHKDS